MILVGDCDDPTNAKTGSGIVHWRPEHALGQLRFPGCKVDLGIPDMDIPAAQSNGAQSLVVGVAPVGGVIPKHWWPIIEQAVDHGLDVVSGLHQKLCDCESLVNKARANGIELIDVRSGTQFKTVANGKKRSGNRLLTVGTDCAVGKKFTALTLQRDLSESGVSCTFRATGQTGIMIAGMGVPIDAVVSDFVAGAAEALTPDNDPDHWDIIEGQGSLHHPAYAAVSLGLLHGSQPDAFVVCHDPMRLRIGEWPDYELPKLNQCIATVMHNGKLTNPNIRCVGVSINSSTMQESQREACLREITLTTGLPCVDPLLHGTQPIVDMLNV